MSNADPPNAEVDLLSAPGPKAKPWSHVIVGMVGAIALGIAAAVLARYFTATRPIDLIPTTAALGDYLEQVLRENLVPAESIHRSPPVAREEAGCRWYYHEFQLDLPAQLSAEGLRALIVRDMSERQVRVSSDDPLEFALGPYPFATVHLRAKSAPVHPLAEPHAQESVAHAIPTVPEVPTAPEPAPTVLHAEVLAASRAVAQAALDTLALHGAPAASLPSLGDQAAGTPESPWVLTQVTLTDWQPPSIEALQSAMNAAVTPLGGSVVTTEYGLQVSHTGHAVVSITLPSMPSGEQPVAVAMLTPAATPESLPTTAPNAESTPSAQTPETPAPLATPPPPLEDLRDATLALGEAVRTALLAAGIESSQLHALPSEPQADAVTQWTRSHFQIRGGVPMPPSQVLAKIVEQVVRPGVEAAMDESAGQPEIVVRLQGREAVLVELAPRSEDANLAVPPDETLPPETMEGQKEGEAAAPTAPVEPAPPAATETPADPAAAGPPRVALIIDDGGYGREVTEAVLGMNPKLTLAILPFTPFGVDTAQRGAALGFEIMLHMPMEPFSKAVKFKGQLNVGMEPAEIARLTQEAIATVPGLVGINNHTGSKFTSDADSMRHFFAALAGQPYYFVDSVTSAKSQAYAIAKEAGIRTARRSVFLDDHADAAYIRKQFDLLRANAKRDGAAIGIGHFRPKTVEVLPSEIEKTIGEGITLVHASELVQ